MRASFLCLVAVTLVSPVLTGQSMEKFTIQGTIGGVDKARVYLQSYVGDRRVLDSAQVSDGKFRLTGMVSEPNLALLFFRGQTGAVNRS